MPNKGELSISTEQKDKHLTINISDTGCGISPQNLNRITDPFFTTKEPGEGTGLGLSIAFSIIKEHKGSISFQSELNVGTSVLVALPINE
ncbi:MAG: hypothetical protein HC896_12975 [Bacteroidales bacterium]|nr:hypothetical protein [Bacteroidales bacterium]